VAKIILTVDDAILREVSLLKERVTIGRRPHNDIVIDNRAISAEHAVIVTIQNDSFLEDLNSTNGTQVNGQPVKKHFLQDNDVIELAQYKIRYSSKSMRIGMGQAVQTHGEPGETNKTPVPGQPPAAVIKVTNGASAGKKIALVKAMTTIGRPGVQVAVITRRPQGYCITHVEGDVHPLVNGVSIGAGTHTLADGDVIDLCGTFMEFAILAR
jgi:hypothetical protein